MTALANPCKVLLCDEPVGRNGLTQKKTANPQQRFADAPALANIQQETKSNNIKTEKSPGGLRSAGEQSVADAPKRKDRSARTGERTPSDSSLPGWSAQTPTQTIKGAPKSDSTRVSPAKTPVEEPTARKMQAGTAPGEPAGAAKPVSAQVNKQAPRESLTDGNRNLAQVPQTESRSAGQENDASRRVGQAGTPSAIPRTSDRPTIAGAPPVVRSVSKDHPGATEQTTIRKPDQTPPKTPSTDHGSAMEVLQLSERSPNVLRSDKHPGVSSGHDRAPISRSPKNSPSDSGFRISATTPGNRRPPSAEWSDPGLAPGSSSNPQHVIASEAWRSSIHNPQLEVPRPVIETQIPTSIDATVAERPARSVSEQILDSMQASLTRGDREVLVRLNPPELGTVLVRLQEQGEHIEGVLEVAQSDTRREIEQALPQVLRSLQEAGVQIHKLEVTASDLPDKDFSRGPLQQDTWSGQHGSGQNRDHVPTSQTSWPSGDADYAVNPDTTLNADPQIRPLQGQLDILL